MTDPDPHPTDPSPAAPAPAYQPYDWDRAREDFLSGEPAVIVAARLGLSERTVTRRAAHEGWRRRDWFGRKIVEPPLDPTQLPCAPLDTLMLAAEVEDAELLESADPRRSIRYAYYRANEAAVRRRPAEALAWARLIEVFQRAEASIRGACGLPSEADALRAIRAETQEARHAAMADELEAVMAYEDEQKLEHDEG